MRLLHHRRDRGPVAALAAISLLAAAGYVALSRAVGQRKTSAKDARARKQVPRRRDPRTKQVVQTLGYTGKPYVHGPIALGLAGFLLRRGHGLSAAVVPVAASASAAVLSRALEQLEKPRRPPPGRHKPSEPSFPSGHALETTAVSFATAYVLARTGETHPLAAGAGAGAISALAGAGRLYLDRHWATDLAGGWLLGVAVAGACAAGYELSRADA